MTGCHCSFPKLDCKAVLSLLLKCSYSTSHLVLQRAALRSEKPKSKTLVFKVNAMAIILANTKLNTVEEICAFMPVTLSIFQAIRSAMQVSDVSGLCTR